MRVAILDDYQDAALTSADWSRFDEAVRIERHDKHLAGADLLEALAGVEVVVAMRERTRFDADLLERLPGVRLIVTTGMANAAIDMTAARRLGIDVCGTRGYSIPAAELAFALILAFARRLPSEVANLRAGGPWQTSLGMTLRDKVLGIAGLGQLGTLVAGYGRAFGMRVVGWSRSNTPERSTELGIGHASSLDEVLAQSDVVSLHLKLTPQTRGIIGARELSLMKSSALLVNTARGELVDEDALVAALQSGSIGGAALDVFATEPLPADHPFRTLDNVIGTPHLGYVAKETYQIYFTDAVEAIAAWRAGAPVRLLNPI